MKKVLALVLAVAMMTSMAMAATLKYGEDTVDSLGASATDDIVVTPGDTLRIFPEDFNDSGVTYDVFDSEYFTLTTKKITKGASLIASVSINDDKGAIDIKFNQDYDLTTSKKNIEIEELAVKTKKVVNEDEANEIKKNKEFEVVKNLSIILTQDKITVELVEDNDVDLNAEGALGKVVSYEKADTNGASYATASVELGDVAYLEGRVYDGDEVYYDYDEDADTDVLKAYPDAEMSFVNIYTNGFPTTMALELYADEDAYVYAIKDGKVVSSGLKWDEDAYAWTGKIRSAASYVISDIELDTSAVVDGDGETDNTTENPETGANDVVGVATALAVVSLVAAGAVSLKK